MTLIMYLLNSFQLRNESTTRLGTAEAKEILEEAAPKETEEEIESPPLDAADDSSIEPIEQPPKN